MRLILSTLALLALGTLPAAAQTATPAEAPPAADAQTSVTQAAPATDAAGNGATPAPEAAAPAGTYVFDPEHSHIVWSYEHLGWSTSTGVVRGLTGSISLDPADPGAAKVEASFPLSALQSVSATLDKDLRGADFFNDAPLDTDVTFMSTAVELTGDKTAKVTGDLTLNGVTKPVTLDVTLRQIGEYPMTGKPGAAFQATGTVKRSDFNLGAFAPAVSDEVQVTINVEAQKA